MQHIVRIGGLQDRARIFCQVGQPQLRIAFFHDLQCARHGVGALITLDHGFGTPAGGHIGPTAQIVFGHVDFELRQAIADIDHVQLGVLAIDALRIVFHQQVEVGERLLQEAGIALVRVAAEQAGVVAVVVRQAAQIVDVVDMRVTRALLDEAIGRRYRRLVLLRLVMCGDRFHFRLRRVGRERKAGLDFGV